MDLSFNWIFSLIDEIGRMLSHAIIFLWWNAGQTCTHCKVHLSFTDTRLSWGLGPRCCSFRLLIFDILLLWAGSYCLKNSWRWRGTPPPLALEFFAKMLHTSFVPIPPKELGGVIVSSLPYYNDNSFDRSQGYKHFCLVVNFCTYIGCYQSCLVAHQAAPISHCFWKATTHFLKHTFWPIWDVPAARHVVIYDKWDNWNRLACPRRNNRGYCHILEFYFPYPNLYNPGWVCRFQGINNLYRLSYTCWIFFFILATLMQIANCGAAYFTVTIALHTFSSLVLRMRQSVVHCRSTMIIGWIFAITVGKWIG